MSNFTLLMVLQFLAAILGIAASIKTLLGKKEKRTSQNHISRNSNLDEARQVWKDWYYQGLEELYESKASKLCILRYKVFSRLDLYRGLLQLRVANYLSKSAWKRLFRRPKL